MRVRTRLVGPFVDKIAMLINDSLEEIVRRMQAIWKAPATLAREAKLCWDQGFFMCAFPPSPETLEGIKQALQSIEAARSTALLMTPAPTAPPVMSGL
jgi:hypothetical protein